MAAGFADRTRLCRGTKIENIENIEEKLAKAIQKQ
jgi:hypothetical protein